MTATPAEWKVAISWAMEASLGVYCFADNCSIIQTTQKALGLPSVVKLCLLLAESHSKSKTIILCLCNIVKALTWAIKNLVLNTHKIMQCRYISACKARHIQPNAVVLNLMGIKSTEDTEALVPSHNVSEIFSSSHRMWQNWTPSNQYFSNCSLIHVNNLSCVDWMQTTYSHTN